VIVEFAEDVLTLGCLTGQTSDVTETSEEHVTSGQACERLASAAGVTISGLHLEDRGFRKPSLRIGRLKIQDPVEIRQRGIEFMSVLFDGRP